MNKINTVFYIIMKYSPSWNISKYSKTMFWNIISYFIILNFFLNKIQINLKKYPKTSLWLMNQQKVFFTKFRKYFTHRKLQY